MNLAGNIRRKRNLRQRPAVNDPALHRSLPMLKRNRTVRQIKTGGDAVRFADRLPHTLQMKFGTNESSVLDPNGFYEKQLIHRNQGIGR